MANQSMKKPGFMSRRLMLGTTVGGAIAFFVVGILFWGGFNTAMEMTNTTEFCIGCHEMEENVYQEYTPTIHYSNRTGVRAGCPDCHVPRPWVHKIVRKIKASNEILHKILGTIDTPEKFDENRVRMAKKVWNDMKSTDSRECRNCHNFESMNPERQKARARKQHLNAFETGQTCIDCHKGIAHHNVRDQLSDEELEEIEAPNPKYIREVPQMFLDGLARVKAAEEQAAIDDAQAAKDAKAEVQAKIDAAVEKALSKANAPAGDASDAAPVASNINVDWSKAGSRDITVFYPGTASIEWIHGRKHGGKRAFTKGDRCTECHESELADMGQNIVSGESEKDLEPNVIPGKRGSIPVNINATYDDEYLYLQFAWEDGKHTPAPFVEGGKMDAQNPVKLAIMLATDEAEYADRAGCWGTCHADVNSMPHLPDAETLAGSDLKDRLDLNAGLTKYVKESRTKLEMKGRRGKKLGGWDKLKDQGEIDSEMQAGKYMDLIRYNAGSKTVEDGHIMEKRDMHSGQGAEAEATLDNGTWTVVIKRKLKSDKSGDISLNKETIYNFGFAIHDDYTNARYHHVSLGYKLGFDNDAAEINAKRQ